MSLTERQKLFCQFYIETGNPEYAISKAGYKKCNYQKLLKNQKVLDYIENFKRQHNLSNFQYIDEAQVDEIASTDEIKKYLTKVLRGQEEQMPSIKEKIKAAELLGKAYSIFSGKIAKTYPDTIIFSGEDDIYE